MDLKPSFQEYPSLLTLIASQRSHATTPRRDVDGHGFPRMHAHNPFLVTSITAHQNSKPLFFAIIYTTHFTSKAKPPLIQSISMDSSTLPCRLLLLPLPSIHRRPNGSKIPREHGGGGRSRGAKMRRNGGGSRVNALFGDGGDGFRAVRRIVKLKSAIQNRSVRELLELVADECQYFFSSVPSVSVSQMGKNMFLFLHAMMLRNHVSFVLKPTQDEGFDLGIKWSLEWKGKKLPWDLDCNVTTTHVYRGLLLISQVNKACVPLLQRILQIIQQNLDAVNLTVANKFLPEGRLDEKESSTIIACVIIGLVVMALFYAMFKSL